MLDFIDPDPLLALLKIAGVVGLVALMIALWFQLMHRSRRFGGGTIAAIVMAASVVGLMVAIAPNFLAFDIGIFVLFACLLAIYRPEQVVKVTGGPSLRYRALREGRELALLVREHGGWSVARRNEEVQARVEGLAAFEGPGTERYIGLVRKTVLADPEAPGIPEKLAELEEADAELRAALKAKPMFEKELARRAAALDAPEPVTGEG
ncbi:MAG TPA: hypothetical protein VES19_14335 [Candidatus Limnocylindrales bacterium]|nr:hypothetical protein [Candidatus Limnocylindrales bacterium]